MTTSKPSVADSPSTRMNRSLSSIATKKWALSRPSTECKLLMQCTLTSRLHSQDTS